MARILVEEPWRSPLVKDVLSFVAPVFPVLLAVTIKSFGLLAPYWLNVVLGCGCLAALTIAFQRMGLSRWERDLALLVTFYLLIAGHWQNPYFLYYPFREMPTFFFLLSSFALLLIAKERCSGPTFFFAGWLLLLAIGTREPAVCALPGALVFVLFPVRGAAKRSWRMGLWLLAPFLLLLAAGLLLASLTGFGMNVQLSTWASVQSHKSPAEFIGVTIDGLSAQLRFLRAELGWAGIVLAGVGVWHWRRQRAALWLFLSTAVLSLVFYSHVGEPHRRYFLAVLLFVAPLVGSGCCGLIQAVAGLLPRRWGIQGAEGKLAAVGMVIVCGALAYQVSLQRPWGPRVDLDDIRFLQRVIAPLAREASAAGTPIRPEKSAALSRECRELFDERNFEQELPFLARFQRSEADRPLFVVEKNNDYLKAALASHTDARFGVQRYVRRELARGVPVYYIKPLTPESYFRGRMIPNLGPPVGEFLRQYADLMPVQGPDNTTLRFALGDGRYELYRVRPWSRTQTTLSLPPPGAGAETLFVDARALWCESAGERTTARLLLDGAPLDERVGDGANYYHVPAPANRATTLILESDRPVPADISARWISPGETVAMDFGLYGFPLHWELLHQGGWKYDKPYWYSATAATVRLPVPGSSSGFLLSEVRLRGMGPGGSSTVGLYAATQKVRSVALPDGGDLQRVVLPLSIPQPQDDLVLRLQPEGAAPSRIEIAGVRLRMFAADRPLAVDVGNEDDEIFLDQGFFGREKDADGRTWRWSGPEARMNLYFPPAQHDWTLRVVFSELGRTEPARVQWTLNGLPLSANLPSDASAAWQTALLRLPASRLLAAANRLELRCIPWSPAKVSASSDTRVLGVRVDRIEMTPVTTENAGEGRAGVDEFPREE